MAEAKKKGPLFPALTLVVLAGAVLAGTAYFLGGADVVAGLLRGSDGGRQKAVRAEPAAEGASKLSLPEGMTEEYALRLWQEQVDSQANIRKLVEGKVDSFDFGSVSQTDDEGWVEFSATFADGSSAPGQFAMRKAGSDWYLEYVSGMRDPDDVGQLSDTVKAGEGEAPDTPLPSLSEVDVELLNAVIDAQRRSQDLLGEYLEGYVRRIVVDEVKLGPNTATIAISIVDKDEIGKAEIVCLTKEFRGQTLWFLANLERKQSEKQE